jgi:hemerythrin superfamily protein
MSNAIEEAAAKAAGKFAAVQATVRGLRGVFRRLAEEHKEIAILLKRAGATNDPKKRASLWARVRAEMTAHERAERQEVYPDFEAHAALSDIVTVHDLEATELSTLIAKIDSTRSDCMQWVAFLKLVEQIWIRHAAREENQFFPRIQAVIGSTRAETLEVRYMATKQTLLRDV